MFCGIETPETEALERMGKTQNLRTPPLEAVRTINSYGIEVVSGIILGLDTDTLRTYANVTSFIESAAIPMCTVNLVQALPGTRLHERLSGGIRTFRGDRCGRQHAAWYFCLRRNGWSKFPCGI